MKIELPDKNAVLTIEGNGKVDGEWWGRTIPFHVDKNWGSEKIWINTNLYCCKTLCINAGQQTSKHLHLKKHEHMLVTKGKLYIEILNKGQEGTFPLGVGGSFVIPPGLIHSLRAGEIDTELIECSTYSRDEDSIRIG